MSDSRSDESDFSDDGLEDDMDAGRKSSGGRRDDSDDDFEFEGKAGAGPTRHQLVAAREQRAAAPRESAALEEAGWWQPAVNKAAEPAARRGGRTRLDSDSLVHL